MNKISGCLFGGQYQFEGHLCPYRSRLFISGRHPERAKKPLRPSRLGGSGVYFLTARSLHSLKTLRSQYCRVPSTLICPAGQGCVTALNLSLRVGTKINLFASFAPSRFRCLFLNRPFA